MRSRSLARSEMAVSTAQQASHASRSTLQGMLASSAPSQWRSRSHRAACVVPFPRQHSRGMGSLRHDEPAAWRPAETRVQARDTARSRHAHRVHVSWAHTDSGECRQFRPARFAPRRRQETRVSHPWPITARTTTIRPLMPIGLHVSRVGTVRGTMDETRPADGRSRRNCREPDRLARR